MNWKTFTRDKYLRNELIITVVAFLVVLFCFTMFLNFNEGRAGISPGDPVLHFFNPINLTWVIFGLIYLSIIMALVYLAGKPEALIYVLQVYALMLLIRMLMMFLLPLNPPSGMIPLNDPFVQEFGTGRLLTKDLFFSGHTATIFMLYLVIGNKYYKKIFLVFTILVAFSLLLQHVHYAVDVASAPFFAYVAYRLIYLLQTKKLKKSLIKV